MSSSYSMVTLFMMFQLGRISFRMLGNYHIQKCINYLFSEGWYVGNAKCRYVTPDCIRSTLKQRPRNLCNDDMNFLFDECKETTMNSITNGNGIGYYTELVVTIKSVRLSTQLQNICQRIWKLFVIPLNPLYRFYTNGLNFLIIDINRVCKLG